MPENPDPLDHLLDEALAEFGRAEPRTGLESRLLAALRARPPLPWWRRLIHGTPGRLALTAATLGGFAVLGVVLGRAGARPAKAPPVAAVRHAPGAAEPAAVPRSAGPSAPPVAALVRSGPSRSFPAARADRRRSFPAESPLGEQEILLLRYIATAPPEEIEPRTGFLDEPAPLPALPDPTTNP